MSLSRFVKISSCAAAMLAGIYSSGAHSQPAGGIRTPQFVATAVGFKALHETHYNWMGSDEVYVVFSDLDPAHDDNASSIFGDVDAGETRNFGAADQCVAPRPSCSEGIPDLHFRLTMWENDDTGFAYGGLTGSHRWLETGRYEGDDLIGRYEFDHDRAWLRGELPTVGMSKDYTVRMTGGAGSYELTYRLSRLPDKLNIPPISPVPVSGIVLQAMATYVNNNGRVTLTWTGASATQVDIYRDGTKVASVANTGSHVDLVNAGMYVYRVCNYQTTFCSADVGVTVG